MGGLEPNGEVLFQPVFDGLCFLNHCLPSGSHSCLVPPGIMIPNPSPLWPNASARKAIRAN